MTLRHRHLPLAVLFAILASLAVAWSGLHTPAFTDYEAEVEPAVDALRRGDVDGFLFHAPAYAGSLILRAPFALAPGLWHGGSLAVFRMLAAPAVLGVALLGLWLWREMAAAGRTRAAWLSLALCTASPLVLRGLDIGHPEEVLGAVLVAAAALAAVRGRPALCGLLLGLALGNKAWAVLAVVPVLLVLRHGRVRAALWSAASAGALLGPLLLGQGAGASKLATSAHVTGQIFQPWQLWWFLGNHDHVVHASNGDVKLGFRSPPEWVGTVARPAVLLVPLLVAVALIVVRRLQRTPIAPADGLALLALSLLLRCLLDPWNIVYYEVPFLLVLLVWELHDRTGPPLLTAAASAAAALTLIELNERVSPDAQCVAFLVWSVPAALALGLRLFAPGATRRWGATAATAARRRMPSLARAAAVR